MKTVIAFWAGCISLVLGLLIWRNRMRYRLHTWLWVCVKSLIETGILMISAIRLPALLCAWVGMWVSKPFKAGWAKVTIGVLIGSCLGFLTIFGREFLLLLSVFAVDEVTGEENGFLKNWGKAKRYQDAKQLIAA